MTTPLAAKWSNGRVWRTRDAAGWLGLAASPTFALMACIAANGLPRLTICSPASGMLPIDGMASMYLLMSVFNLSPWLKLAFR
jgi:hypothetical protein